jgi:hypothetical protein
VPPANSVEKKIASLSPQKLPRQGGGGVEGERGWNDDPSGGGGGGEAPRLPLRHVHRPSDELARDCGGARLPIRDGDVSLGDGLDSWRDAKESRPQSTGRGASRGGKRTVPGHDNGSRHVGLVLSPQKRSDDLPPNSRGGKRTVLGRGNISEGISDVVTAAAYPDYEDDVGRASPTRRGGTAGKRMVAGRGPHTESRDNAESLESTSRGRRHNSSGDQKPWRDASPPQAGPRNASSASGLKETDSAPDFNVDAALRKNRYVYRYVMPLHTTNRHIN